MFADDILLLSETADGLQKSISKLHEYCAKWQLSINAKKSKVMIFSTQKYLKSKTRVLFRKGKTRKSNKI